MNEIRFFSFQTLCNELTIHLLLSFKLSFTSNFIIFVIHLTTHEIETFCYTKYYD